MRSPSRQLCHARRAHSRWSSLRSPTEEQIQHFTTALATRVSEQLAAHALIVLRANRVIRNQVLEERFNAAGIDASDFLVEMNIPNAAMRITTKQVHVEYLDGERESVLVWKLCPSEEVSRALRLSMVTSP